jgi:DNA-binding response OmpR family regulator
MQKSILDVGQCGYDGPRLTRLLETKVGVQVDSADTLDEAAEKLSANDYDLILVNRELAVDGSSGLDLLRWLKEQGNDTPAMLVSDLPEAQAQAVELGALKGFGKSHLDSASTVRLIKHAIKL